jgi:hypothetical protein
MGKQAEVRQCWRERMAAQEASGLSVRAYCNEHGIGEHSFYSWRQRLRRESQPVSFALVESKQEAKPDGAGVAEVVLTGGERLRIPCEEGTLSVVLRVLRALG